MLVQIADRQSSDITAPCVKVCREDGTETGLAFHGVPSGHEFTSFVLGLYNAAGPGQAIDAETKRIISKIQNPVDMKILVTLSCSMCPDLVTAAQRIAAENAVVSAEVYDIHHFPELKSKFNVMSVPCLIINDQHVLFGKKKLSQLADMLSGLM